MRGEVNVVCPTKDYKEFRKGFSNKVLIHVADKDNIFTRVAAAAHLSGSAGTLWSHSPAIAGGSICRARWNYDAESTSQKNRIK